MKVVGLIKDYTILMLCRIFLWPTNFCMSLELKRARVLAIKLIIIM